MMKKGKFDHIRQIHHLKYLLPLGFLSGVINGLFGCGGGVVSVAAFSVVLKRERNPEKRTREVFAMTVASVAVMSLSSAFVYRDLGAIEWDKAAEYLLPAAGGGAVGALLLGRINTKILKKIFAALIIYSGIKMALF